MSRKLNHISVVSKLDGIKSWSLMSRETCPGSIGPDGDLVEVCRGCYAGPNVGNYRFSNVKKARRENKKAWEKDWWVDEMVSELEGEKYFRWMDSGDCYCVDLAVKILDIIRKTPDTSHWLSTRSYKIPEIKEVLEEMKKEDNAYIRYSADRIGEYKKGLYGSVVIPYYNYFKKKEVHECQAYKEENGNTCNGCRKCWSDQEVIAYIAHGRPMSKILKEKR